MRSTILAVSAAALLGLSSSVMAFGGGQFGEVTHSSTGNSGSLTQGSSVSAGSVSGATTTGTGFAGTYGIANMHANTTGQLKSDSSLAVVKGTTYVSGHSESGTYVEGAGAAGSIAGGEADASVVGQASFNEGTHQHFCIYLCGPAYNEVDTMSGEAEINAGAQGSSWAASGSIGDGEGLSVQGFEAYGEAKAKSKISGEDGEYTAKSNVDTASGAVSYTIEEGNAIGETHAIGWGLAGADVYRLHEDDDSNNNGSGGNPCGGNCGNGGGNGGGNGTGNEGGGQGPS